MLNAIRIAFRAIRRNGLRSFLTVLGILIGVSAVVIVTALGTGARENVSKQVESFGSNFIIVFPQAANVSGAKGAAGTSARLTEDDERAIHREAVSIAGVAPALRTRANDLGAGAERRSDAGDADGLAMNGALVVLGEARRGARSTLRTGDVGGLREDDDEVRAEGLDLLRHVLARAGAQRRHDDDGRHADEDAEHGEERAEPVAANGAERDADGVVHGAS